jgi:hypothetical protein
MGLGLMDIRRTNMDLKTRYSLGETVYCVCRDETGHHCPCGNYIKKYVWNSKQSKIVEIEVTITEGRKPKIRYTLKGIGHTFTESNARADADCRIYCNKNLADKIAVHLNKNL